MLILLSRKQGNYDTGFSRTLDLIKTLSLDLIFALLIAERINRQALGQSASPADTSTSLTHARKACEKKCEAISKPSKTTAYILAVDKSDLRVISRSFAVTSFAGRCHQEKEEQKSVKLRRAHKKTKVDTSTRVQNKVNSLLSFNHDICTRVIAMLCYNGARVRQYRPEMWKHYLLWMQGEELICLNF